MMSPPSTGRKEAWEPCELRALHGNSDSWTAARVRLMAVGATDAPPAPLRWPYCVLLILATELAERCAHAAPSGKKEKKPLSAGEK